MVSIGVPQNHPLIFMGFSMKEPSSEPGYPGTPMTGWKPPWLRLSGLTTPSCSWINTCQMSTTRPRRWRISGESTAGGVQPIVLFFNGDDQPRYIPKMVSRNGHYLDIYIYIFISIYLDIQSIIFTYRLIVTFGMMIVPNPWSSSVPLFTVAIDRIGGLHPHRFGPAFQEHGGLHWCSAHPFMGPACRHVASLRCCLL